MWVKGRKARGRRGSILLRRGETDRRNGRGRMGMTGRAQGVDERSGLVRLVALDPERKHRGKGVFMDHGRDAWRIVYTSCESRRNHCRGDGPRMPCKWCGMGTGMVVSHKLNSSESAVIFVS